MTQRWNMHAWISLFASKFKVPGCSSVFVMMSSAGISISMSTLIFTSSWAVSSEEQPAFMPAQQAWIQSLLADMSQYNPLTSTTSAASSMAMALTICNTTGTLSSNIHECIVRCTCMNNSDSQPGMHKHSKVSNGYTQISLLLWALIHIMNNSTLLYTVAKQKAYYITIYYLNNITIAVVAI